MNFAIFPPHPLLRGIVECYWIAEGEQLVTQKIVPDGHSEIIFHFGDPYQISKCGVRFDHQPMGLIGGQIDRPLFLRPSGKSGVLGIKFAPAGLWQWRGIDMHLLTNEVFPFSDVAGIEGLQILEKIRNAHNHLARIAVVENFLLSQSRAMSNDDVNLIVQNINSTNGQIAIRDLSNQHKISLRKIERLFQQRVGISAKAYARIVRFKKIQALLKQNTLRKAEAVYLAGYFDQAHFNKDFSEFSGENPRSFLSRQNAFSDFFLSR